MQKISVILPFYNEEKRILATLKEVEKFSKKNKNFDFLFVDDGSNDKTLDILRKEKNSQKIRILSYTKNKGKGHAIRTGVKYVDGNLICFMDSDLAYSLEHLFEMKERLNDFDVVIGCRGLAEETAKNVPMIRKIFGVGFNILSRAILNLNFRDMQAGVKGFKREVAKKLFQNQKINGFSFDTEILYLAKKYKYSIGKIPARVSNNNSYSISKVNLFRDTLKMFLSLFIIRLNDLIGKYE